MSIKIPEKLYRISLEPNLNEFIPKKAQIPRVKDTEDIVVCTCPEWWMCINQLPPKYFQNDNKYYIYEITDTKNFEAVDPLVNETKEVYEYRSHKKANAKMIGKLKHSAVESVLMGTRCSKCKEPSKLCDDNGCVKLPELKDVIE
jgi:hypothetical protein